MGRRLTLLLFCIAIVTAYAQESRVRLTPEMRARKLLDNALDLASATPPEVHGFALLHIADNYRVFSAGRSEELFERAFSIASGVEEPRQRAVLQSEIVKSIAASDPAAAARLIPLLSTDGRDAEARRYAVQTIVARLLMRNGVTAANDLLAVLPSRAEYPFGAAHDILKTSVASAPEHQLVFGRALAAYAQFPHGPFPTLLSIYAEELPEGTRQSALTALKLSVETEPNRERNSSAQNSPDSVAGGIDAATRDRLEALQVLRSLAPEQAQELLAKSPAARALSDSYPNPVPLRPLTLPDPHESPTPPSAIFVDPFFYLDNGWSLNPAVGLFDAKDAAAAADSVERAAKVMALAERDPTKAYNQVSNIPLIAYRIDVLSAIARYGRHRGDRIALTAYSEARTLVNYVKEPATRVFALIAVAHGARGMGNEPATEYLLTEALRAAGDVYRWDADAKQPNTALLEYWPSTQCTRQIIYHAMWLLPYRAESLLAGVESPSIALLARIELAQSLLQHPPTWPRMLFVNELPRPAASRNSAVYSP